MTINDTILYTIILLCIIALFGSFMLALPMLIDGIRNIKSIDYVNATDIGDSKE